MKESWKLKIPYAFAAAGCCSFACAAVIFSAVAEKATQTYQVVFGSICGGLMMLITVLIVLYLILIRETEPNYFLFNRKKRKNIPVEKLEYPLVHERMSFLLGQLCENPAELWTSERMRGEDERFGYRSVYKPLVAYRMLYDLQAQDADEALWQSFRQAPEQIVEAVLEALERAGENRMTAAFRKLSEKGTDEEKLKFFLRENRNYLKSRMVFYVKKHIEMFY